MRRTLSILATSVLLVVLTALPALATEGATEAAESSSTDWSGMIYAVVLGVVMGFLAFFDAGMPSRADEHH